MSVKEKGFFDERKKRKFQSKNEGSKNREKEGKRRKISLSIEKKFANEKVS